MSTLSSSSTDAQVEAAYDDNASYAEDDSPSKARAFITACRIRIGRAFSTATKGSNTVSLPVERWSQELKAAQDWLLAYDTTERANRYGPSVTLADFRNMRRE